MKNHITVVPSDHLIMVEGEPLFFGYSPLFPMRALQWHEGAGHIEIEGQVNRKLTRQDYITEVLPYVALHEAEKERRLTTEVSPPDEPEETLFLEALAQKRTEILEGANQSYLKVTAKYSIPEERSWEKQKSQAEALLKDENAPAPEIRALAANRNIPVLMFARRILANATQAEELTLSIILQQQSYEDMLDAAKTLDEIKAMRVQYTLPMEETE